MLKVFVAKNDQGRKFLINTEIHEVLEVEELNQKNLYEVNVVLKKGRLPKGKPIGRATKITKTKQGLKVTGRLNQGKSWSSKFEACQDCGTTEKKHIGQGYCGTCYYKNVLSKGKDAKKKSKFSKKRYQARDDDGPVSSAAHKYTCRECDHKFTSVLELMDVVCPECRSNNISE